jgi:hypothetical protein
MLVRERYAAECVIARSADRIYTTSVSSSDLCLFDMSHIHIAATAEHIAAAAEQPAAATNERAAVCILICHGL